MRERGRNPYVGPRAFEEEDRQYFFGRDEEARQLTALVAAHRVVLFYAQSGAGKTSLLQAQVLPDLAQQGIMVVLPIGRVGGGLRPDADPAGIANIYVFNLLRSLASHEAGPKRTVDPLQYVSATLVAGLRPYIAAGGGVADQAAFEPLPQLLVLDQFEELFTTYPERSQERAAFFRQLQECLQAYPDLGLLLAMREDYIALLDDHASQMPDRLRTRFRIERLTRAAAREAVKGPAAKTGCPFRPEVADELVKNLSRVQPGRTDASAAGADAGLGDYVEPVHLQIVCWRLWENLPLERTEITADDVRAFADVDQALMEFYEGAVREVLKRVVVGQRLLRSWFETALITPARTRGLVYRGEGETEGLPNSAVDVLYNAYLIRPAPRGGDTWYELAHDRLVNPILEANRLWREERQRAATPTDHAAAPLPAAASTTQNPYVGPRSFRTSERLSGRSTEVAALLDLLITERIVLFYSPPGAGKTSLLQAGLLPAVEAERFRVLGPLRMGHMAPPGATPEPGSGAYNRFILSILLELEDLRADSERIPLAGLKHISLGEYLERYPADPTYAGDVLVFDQVEEVLTLDAADRTAKEDFFRQVGEALNDPRRRGLLAIREEFIAGLDPYAAFIPGQLRARFRLEPLGVAGALEVIRDGALQGGRAFAPGVAERLVDALRMVTRRLPDGTLEQVPGPTVEPLQLQLVLYRLWNSLAPDATVIGLDDLRAEGSVGDAQREYYADQVRQAAEATGVSERFLRAWIQGQLIGTSGERRQVPVGPDATEGLPNATVGRLVDSFVFRIEAIRGIPWLSLSHDLFVAAAREDNAAWLSAHESIVQRGARLWDTGGRPDGLLLDAPALREAEAWASAHSDALLPVERDFLAASAAAAAAAEYKQLAERRIRRLAVGATILAVLALVAAGVAAALWRSASLAQRTAEAAEVAARFTANAAQVDRRAAEEAATQVDAARGTAVIGRVTAEAALVSLAANIDFSLTEQARPSAPVGETPAVTPVPPPSPTPSSTATLIPTATPAGSIGPTPAPPGTDTRAPTATGVPTMTRTPTPTPNQTVIAQQRQLAEARAALARIARESLLPSPLVFTSDRSSGRHGLWLMSTSGAVTPLAGAADVDYYRPSVARSSRGVTVVAATANYPEPNGRLDMFQFVPDMETSRPTVIDSDSGSRWDPAIAPGGGARILFASDATGNPDIYLLNSIAASPVNLTNSDFEEHAPAWSPDGRRIALTGRAAGQSDIWIMDADGGNLQQLTDSPRIDTYPAWSPDGRFIAFASNRDDPTNRHPDIYVIELQTGALRNLTNSPSADENYPAWSPDGQWLAYARYTTNSEIFVVPFEGGTPINVTSNPADDSYPAWW